MDIEIQKSPPLQEGRPGSVHLLLRDDNGETKGVVSVSPVWAKPDEEGWHKFRVEVFTAETISRVLDIKVTI